MPTPMPKRAAKVRPIAAARTILQARLPPLPLSLFRPAFILQVQLSGFGKHKRRRAGGEGRVTCKREKETAPVTTEVVAVVMILDDRHGYTKIQ